MDNGRLKGTKGRDRLNRDRDREAVESPAKLLTMRLEKLERDLQLLTGIQTLLMTSDHNRNPNHNNGFSRRLSMSCGDPSDIPERDSDHGNYVGQDRTDARNSTGTGTGRSRAPWNSNANYQHGDSLMNQEMTAPSSSSSGLKRKKISSEKTRDISSSQLKSHNSSEMQDKSTETYQMDELEGNLDLLEALNYERKKRVDTEDSARVVAIKLQQAEDELGRERETKQMLLVGTLQLKNQISSQESHIKECEANLKELRVETGKLRESVEVVNGEKMMIAKKCKDVIFSLKADKKSLESQNQKLSADKAEVESQLQDKRKDYDLKEQSLQAQDQRNATKYNQIITKCAQVDKERQDLALELRGTLEKLQISEEALKESQETLRRLQTESERETILKDCILQKLKCDMGQQQKQFESQMQDSHLILTKTKSLIIQVRKERDNLRQQIKQCKEENQMLTKESHESAQTHDRTLKEYQDFKNSVKNVQKMNGNYMDKLKKDNSSLKSLIRNLQKEKNLQSKLHLAAENEFLKEKATLDEKIKTLSQEHEHATNELSRCMDNLRVLQKVSEDQTRSIQTLRGERDEQRKVKFSLETEIRERDATEAVLSRKLDGEQRKSGRLEDTVEKYEEKLSALEEELRDHNCEDFVEANMKRKLAQIESEVKGKYEEWEESIENARAQRDKAIRESNTKQKEADEVKSDCDNRILEITTTAKQDYQRLKTESKRILTEKATKIMELEGELEQLKLQSNQMQRGLCGKIQQLQCALNVCITSNTTSAFGNTNATIGPNPFSHFL